MTTSQSSLVVAMTTILIEAIPLYVLPQCMRMYLPPNIFAFANYGTQRGLFSDSSGGCGTLNLVGNFTDFLSLTAHGLTSAGFPTIFPSSYRFSPHTSLSHCMDLRDYVLAFNVVVTALLFLVLRPKPIFLYWCLVCIGFWHGGHAHM